MATTEATSATTEGTIVEKLFESSIATLELAAVMIGHELGLYGALAEGSATSAELAVRTATDERYIREWLEQQAAAGYLSVDDPAAAPGERRFTLPPGAERVLSEPDSPSYLAPLAECTVGALAPIDALIAAFRTGEGVPYPDYGRHTRDGIGAMNRAMFINELGSSWFPAIDEVHARLAADPPARVADMGCGTGWSSIAIADAYPSVRVDGFDNDAASIATARANVAARGLSDRVRHFVQDAGDASVDGEYDLVTIFEALHDMAHPVAALETARRLLREGGSVVIADERVGEKFTAPSDPVERFMYGWSVVHCLPVGREDDHSACTGTVMRPETVRRYAAEAGFAQVEILPVENDFWRFYRLTV